MDQADFNVHDVFVYVDEVKEFKNALNEKWMYIGILVVRQWDFRKALYALKSDRGAAKYPREVHFTDLRQASQARYGEKTELARRWLQRVLSDREKIFNFALLGINLTNLEYEAFGKKRKDRQMVIYNRFFRSALAYALCYFFDGSYIIVKHLFHDVSNFSRSDWFRQNTPRQLNENADRIHVRDAEISFINSDHARERTHPDHSHFVQLCDVLLGAMTQVLDDRSTKDGCNELAEMIQPLMQCLTNPECSQSEDGDHYRRLYASFFPSMKLKPSQLEVEALRASSSFYVKRKLLWESETFSDENS